MHLETPSGRLQSSAHVVKKSGYYFLTIFVPQLGQLT
jgi:hypothetical protein